MEAVEAPHIPKKPDRRGWPNAYETVFVLPNDRPDEAADKAVERMRGVVEANGGRVFKVTYWGRRKTAFELAKAARAIFVQIEYLGGGRTVEEVERALRNAEEVIRYQTARTAKLVDPESHPAEPDVRLQGDLDERPIRPEAAALPIDTEIAAEEAGDETGETEGEV